MVTDQIYWDELFDYIDQNYPLENGYMATNYQSRARTCYIIQKLWSLASVEYLKNLKPQDIVQVKFNDTISCDKPNELRDIFLHELWRYNYNNDMNFDHWLCLQMIVNKMNFTAYCEYMEFYSNTDYTNLLSGMTATGYGIDDEIEKTWSALKVLIRKKQKEN